MINDNCTVRRASAYDLNSIKEILSECDMGNPPDNINNFWVAEINNNILGTAEISNYEDFNFLSYLGVRPEYRKNGIASKLLETVLRFSDKDTYIYTIIPEYFLKRGFSETKLHSFLPSQDSHNCEGCDRAKCKCMVKYAYDSFIS